MEAPAAAADPLGDLADGEADRVRGDFRADVEALPFAAEREEGEEGDARVVLMEGRTSGAIGFAGGSAN